MVLQNPFQAERELDGLSKVLVDVKQPILYAGAAVFLAVAALLGSLVGTKAPGENVKLTYGRWNRVYKCSLCLAAATDGFALLSHHLLTLSLGSLYNVCLFQGVSPASI